jgi:rubrerythrin
MSILIPTKDTGATAKANEVLYVEPQVTVDDELLATELPIEGVDAAFVADLLSACLTHERCGVHLYRSVAGRSGSATLQRQYEAFGAETERHVEVLEELIAAAGGNPSYVSPLARAVEASDSRLLESTFLASGALDPMVKEMTMLDAVFLAETVDHANWQTLGVLAEQLPDGQIKDALRAAVNEVFAQEDEHLAWARDARAELTLSQVAAEAIAVAGTAVPVDDATELQSWTKEELYAEAKQREVPGRSEMTKDELVRALRKHKGAG